MDATSSKRILKITFCSPACCQWLFASCLSGKRGNGNTSVDLKTCGSGNGNHCWGITGGYFQKLVTPKCKLSRLPEVIVLFKNIYIFTWFSIFWPVPINPITTCQDDESNPHPSAVKIHCDQESHWDHLHLWFLIHLDMRLTFLCPQRIRRLLRAVK